MGADPNPGNFKWGVCEYKMCQDWYIKKRQCGQFIVCVCGGGGGGVHQGVPLYYGAHNSKSLITFHASDPLVIGSQWRIASESPQFKSLVGICG